MMKGKKASMFLIVFFIAVVMIIFYMIGLQGRTPSLGVQTATQTERPHHYAEFLKRFALEIASESLTKASYEEALALKDHNIIYDSQPNPIDINQVSNNIAERTRLMVNDYLLAVEGFEFGTVDFEETTQIVTASVPVTEMDLIEGLVYDNFYGIFTGSELNRIVNTETGEESTFVHQYHVSTQCDRFWYLTHVLNQWSTTNLVSTLVCNSMPVVQIKGSGRLYYPVIDEDTARSITDRVFEDLQSRFDEHVTCTYTLADLTSETEVIIDDDPDPCPTPNPPLTCGGGCPGGDDYETQYNNCVGLNNQIIYDGGEWHPGGKSVRLNCGGIGQTHTMIFTMKISCTDYKCANPVSAEGMEYLTMNVSAHVHQTHHTDPPRLRCRGLRACEVPGGSTEKGDTTEPRDKEGKPDTGGGTPPGDA